MGDILLVEGDILLVEGEVMLRSMDTKGHHSILRELNTCR